MYFNKTPQVLLVLQIDFFNWKYIILIPLMQEFKNINTSNTLDLVARLHRVESRVVGHYKLGRRLGKGGFAVVYEAVELNTKMPVAVKIIQKTKYDDSQLVKIRREVQIHMKLQHEHIARIYQIIQTNSKIYIFMELCENGELFDLINRQGHLSEVTAAKIFTQLYSAICYLHQQKIAHRDIKTENILFDGEMNVKLIDFGLANRYGDDQKLKTYCGSPSYLAPEVVFHREYNAKAIDVWCLGVTLYTMLQAQLPFFQEQEKNQKTRIVGFRYHRINHMDSSAAKLINDIFVPEKERISLEDIPETAYYKTFCHRVQHSATNTLNRQLIEIISIKHMKSQEEILQSVLTYKLDQNYSLYHLYQQKIKKHGEIFDQTPTMSFRRKRSRKSVQLETISTPKNSKQNKHIDLTPNPKTNLMTIFDKKKQKRPEYRIKMSTPQKQKIKIRLREDSPDSPRRLIDHIRGYK